MNTLILNGLTNAPFTLKNYNRNTSFDLENHTMNSVAYFDIDSSSAATAALQEMGQTEITSIIINHNDTEIYNLSNITAKIATINETLYEDIININVSIIFN